jgi:hypothetical protein
MIYCDFTPVLCLRRAERLEKALWAILAKKPACREGVRGRVKKNKTGNAGCD